jgi:hypothetical protein
MPIIPEIIIPLFPSFLANFIADADVYPYPIAAPKEDMSTIHPRAVLPKNGAINEITITNKIAFCGVLYSAFSFPNHFGRTPSSDMEYSNLLVAI